MGVDRGVGQAEPGNEAERTELPWCWGTKRRLWYGLCVKEGAA